MIKPLPSLRSFASIALLAAAAVTAGAPTPASAAPTTPGAYYMALGDSLAYGISAVGVPVDPSCAAPTSFGYVCLVYRYLKQAQPGLQLVNLSHPEEDSCELLNGYGNGSPCTRILDGPIPAPLPQAIQFLRDHPGQVNPVTINIGGNDLLPLLPDAALHPFETAAQLPRVFSDFTRNLDSAFSQLRSAAGPSTEIIIANQYNPLGGIGSPPLPSGLPQVGQSAINGLNNVMKTEGAKYGILYADDAAAFDANPGGAAVLTWVPATLASNDPTKMNILPTTDGYRIYAGAVLKASSFLRPQSVKSALKSRNLARKSRIVLTGLTSAFSTITVTLKPPKGKARIATLAADEGGAFSFQSSTGKVAGGGTIRACAVDLAGQSACGSTVHYRVK